MNNPKKVLLGLSLILLTHAFSQSNYVSGYILINNNDTVKGYIKEAVESDMLTEITFSNNEKGESGKNYSSHNIRGFHLDNGNFFEAVSFTDLDTIRRTYFSKKLISGYYNLYSFIKSDMKRYIVKHDDSSFFLYDDKILFDGSFDVRGNYRNQLFFISRNCSKLNETVSNLRYSDDVLMNFITKINACIAPEKISKTVYVKPKATNSFFIYGGGLPLGEKYEFTGRAGIKFSTPSISKNTSLNVTLAYLANKSTETINTAKKDHITNIFSAGLTIQNNFTNGVIQPFIEAGIAFGYKQEKNPLIIYASSGFQNKYGIDFIGAIGIEGFITKNLAIKADWRYELLTHYPVIGVAYFIR